MNFQDNKVNTTKTSFITGTKNFSRLAIIKGVIGYSQKNLPFNYLDCLIHKGRVTRRLFASVLSKMIQKFQGWQGKLLSNGSKLTLIESVLIAMLVYYFSLLYPIAITVREMKNILVDFFGMIVIAAINATG